MRVSRDARPPLDFSDTGEVGLLIDQGSVALREAAIGKGGILPGKELAFTFGTLRANDLIWRYVVDSYLKGATPDAFDLLYWDSDSVSLPGVPVDLSKVKVPLYVLASREDHIVPWKSAYGSKDLIGINARFVSLPRVVTLRASLILRPATSAATGRTISSYRIPILG